MRQKIIFADKENKSKYEHTLFNLLFRQSVETGIREETLRAELAPLLNSSLMKNYCKG
jgi:hypothetical protein